MSGCWVAVITTLTDQPGQPGEREISSGPAPATTVVIHGLSCTHWPGAGGRTKKPKCKPRVLHTQSQASQRPYTSYTDTQQLPTASTRTLLSVRVEHHPGTRTTCWSTCRGSPRQGEYWPSLERGMWRTFRPSQWDMRSLSTDCAEENCLHVLRDSIGTSWLYLFYVYKLLNSKNAWKYSPGPNKLLIV